MALYSNISKPVMPYGVEKKTKGWVLLDIEHITILSLLSSSSDGLTYMEITERIGEDFNLPMYPQRAFAITEQLCNSGMARSVVLHGKEAKERAGAEFRKVYYATELGEKSLLDFIGHVSPLVQAITHKHN